MEISRIELNKRSEELYTMTIHYNDDIDGGLYRKHSVNYRILKEDFEDFVRYVEEMKSKRNFKGYLGS